MRQECLQDLLISAKNCSYQSDSRIFSSEIFVKDCRKKILTNLFSEDCIIIANIRDTNESRIPHFSKFCSRLLKLSIREKIPDRPLEKRLKLIRDISEKSGQVPYKIPHKSPFFSIIPALLFFQAKLKLFIFAQF